MKQGITMNELAAEVRRQDQSKKDYIVSSDSIYLQATTSGITMRVSQSGTPQREFFLNNTAHNQLASYLDIPRAYYDKMLCEQPDLLTENVNRWLQCNPPKQRMLRTLDGTARAFLSDRYRRIDNAPLMRRIEPVLGKFKDLTVKSCQITDTNLYVKLVNPKLEGDVKVGDTVQMGVIITNSEVGCGSVCVYPMLYRLVCSNGMVAQRQLIGITQRHIGRKSPLETQIAAYDDEVLDKVGESIRIAFDRSQFNALMAQMQESRKLKIKVNLAEQVVEAASKHFGISKFEAEGVSERLMESEDFTLYGLANAVTRHAQDVKSYDRSTELETTGYKIMTMSPALWNIIISQARKEAVML